jgi:YgiT-type zinc finger domain-containing protein
VGRESKVSTCVVCDATESREELVDEVFCIEGQYVLVGGIPAEVCVRCGEQSFSRETAERVRMLVRDEADVEAEVSMRVYEFAR